MRRILTAVLTALLLLALVPGVASATDAEQPLAEVPAEYDPALEAAQQELGTDLDLRSATRAELETLFCEELAGLTADEVAARADDVLASIPEEDLEELTPEDRAAIEAQLPTLLATLKADLCNGDEAASTAAAETDDDDSDAADDGGIVTPNRIDTGSGGGSSAVPTGLLAAVVALAALVLAGVGYGGRRGVR